MGERLVLARPAAAGLIRDSRPKLNLLFLLVCSSAVTVALEFLNELVRSPARRFRRRAVARLRL
ncbi:MAG: hypothetical protein CTY36_06910 [Methylocystis sp.]|nr:MAG: hypothetical protein CTY36_06910 [Methylocystis sp.]